MTLQGCERPSCSAEGASTTYSRDEAQRGAPCAEARQRRGQSSSALGLVPCRPDLRGGLREVLRRHVLLEVTAPQAHVRVEGDVGRRGHGHHHAFAALRKVARGVDVRAVAQGARSVPQRSTRHTPWYRKCVRPRTWACDRQVSGSSRCNSQEAMSDSRLAAALAWSSEPKNNQARRPEASPRSFCPCRIPRGGPLPVAPGARERDPGSVPGEARRRRSLRMRGRR